MSEASDVVDYRPGLRCYTTPSGVRVCELDYWANPAHTPEWANAMRPLYLTTKDWRREMERDWSSPAGEPYFPEFTEAGGRDIYVYMQSQFVEQWPVFRAFDFGRRRPACIWFQYSPTQDRLVAYREFMPHQIGTHQFRDAVKYLSGQMTWKELEEKEYHLSMRWVEEYKARPSGAHCPPPWFPPGTHFLDVGGKEANQTNANAPQEEDAVASQIFAAGGINLIIVNPRILGRNHILDRMLTMRSDGYPGLLIDPQMEESIEGFSGAWAYPEPSKAVPIPTKPKDDGHYINLLDAWGYGAAAVVPSDAEPDKPERRIIGYRGGRTPIYTTPEVEDASWYETRRSG
jgi:hypothetical protein